jgi:Predicted integral membrane protein (DUF2269)
MTFYSLALFAHIVGVMGLFIAIGLAWISIVWLQIAQTVAQVRERINLASIQERLLPVASVLILLAGIYMTVAAWGWTTPWIDVSLAALVVMGALGGTVINRRFKAMRIASSTVEASVGSIPAELKRQIADPVLWTAVQANGFIALGVVFLMTIKPDLVGSLVTLVVALVLGVVSALIWRPREATVPMQEAQLSDR